MTSEFRRALNPLVISRTGMIVYVLHLIYQSDLSRIRSSGNYHDLAVNAIVEQLR
jgi:hypothetical protein